MLWAIQMSLKGQSQEKRSWEMSEEFITINSKCNWKNSNKCKFFKKNWAVSSDSALKL